MDDTVLFERYAETKDVALRNAIAEKYLYMAEIMAKKFANKGVEYDDLYQIAGLALVKAVERFDPKMGLKFVTFATPTITGEIKNYFRDKSRTVRLPRKYTGLAAEIRVKLGECERDGRKAPSAADLAADLGVSEEDVAQAMEAVYRPISLDMETEEGGLLYEIIPDERDDYAAFETSDAVRTAVAALSENERELVDLRFRAGKSQAEIAKKWGVSQMFVSRLERKVLLKLRAAFDAAE